MLDRLLFDVVLHAGGLHDPPSHFPPSDANALTKLLRTIDGLNFDSLKRDCLVYSLLKWHKDGREELFREEKCIPPQFSALSDAYWCLDAGIDVEVSAFLLYVCVVVLWGRSKRACETLPAVMPRLTARRHLYYMRPIYGVI